VSRPGRSLVVARLPVDLLDELDREARRRGLTVETLVDELLVTTLPIVLAEAAEAHLRTSLDIARRHAIVCTENKQGPAVLTCEALNDEDFSQAHVEHQYIARPAIEGTSGGRAS
jgi:hypothetical protein